MVVAGGVGGGGGGVLSSGSLGAPEGNFVPSLGSPKRLKEPVPQEGPGSPRKGQTGQNQPKTPYI